jgi:osmotically-inducible protein OsmY
MTSFDGSGRRVSGRWLAALAALSVSLGASMLRADGVAQAAVSPAASPAVDAAASPAQAERTDSEIRKDVFDQILGYAWYTVFDSVEAGVDNGVVTLHGSVNQPYRKTDIEKRVAGIAGVKQVRSEIRVQGVSSFDDRLRRELVYRIYGDERFAQYASWVHPPIRIVVDKGRITLTGLVGSAVEQQLVGHIARGTLAFAVDNQVKLESDLKLEPARKASVES